jgi:hypothetical protein
MSPGGALPIRAATGLGAMPGTDVRSALGIVLDTVPDLPFLPELPARGPGADPVGRTLALMPDLPGEYGPAGWSLIDRAGRDARRARSLLGEDLDALEEYLGAWDGALKVQLCGPWTLAATVELRGGHKLLADAGATRDLHQAYAEAVRGFAMDIGGRVPVAGPYLVQLDEPALSAIMLGDIETPSGFGRLPGRTEPELENGLASVFAAQPDSWLAAVRCPPTSESIRLVRAAGAHAVVFDASGLTEDDDGAIGEAVEAGVRLLAGVVPVPAATPAAAAAGAGAVAAGDSGADSLRRLWHRLGQPAEELASIIPTPTVGLDGVTAELARSVLARATTVARMLADDPDDEASQSAGRDLAS